MKRAMAIILVLAMTLTFGCSKAALPEQTTSSEEVSSEQAAQQPAQPAEESSEAPGDGNLFVNGGFDTDTNPWGLYLEGGDATMVAGNGECVVDIARIGSVTHGVQIFQDGFAMETNCKYRLTFDAKADIDRSVMVRVQKNSGDYKGYLEEVVNITGEMKTYTYDFEMTDVSDPAPRFTVNLGLPKDGSKYDKHKVYFDNMRLEVTDDSKKVTAKVSTLEEKKINVDQVGYRPQDKKLAVFVGTDSKFEVVDAKTEKVVYTGDITLFGENSQAGQTNSWGDFSEVKTEGEYFVRTASLGESYRFKISGDVYNSAFSDIYSMFYMQRCGEELPAAKAGDWAHAACHTSKAVVYGTDIKLDTAGGWHDAGDYGRYVVPAAKAVADLMLAWQDNNAGVQKGMSDKLPGCLDEVCYELEWMLKMQDKTSGGVYHKVSAAKFCGEIMPEEEKEELILSPISNTATADFAAAMAMAYTVYKDVDKAFADSCLAAAEKAWEYVSTHNDGAGFKNPKDILTGEYGDGQAKDERFWAAAELLKATGNAKYNEYIVSSTSSIVPLGMGWTGVGFYGCRAYLDTPEASTNADTRARIKDTIIREADDLLKAAKANGYMISITNYNWGSNMSVANNAMLLLWANRIAPNAEYVQLAEEHMHYLLGRNAMSISYVTGVGTQYAQHPHHRPSQAIDKTVPGMLVGGPDSAKEDPYAKAVLKGTPAAKCYCDNEQSYSTNEITIYWNSPLIYLMAQYM